MNTISNTVGGAVQDRVAPAIRRIPHPIPASDRRYLIELGKEACNGSKVAKAELRAFEAELRGRLGVAA